jgi:DNA sulfur modification protein DndD
LNFKLLRDFKIDISTDPSRPLTVIRAENGSGKTSFYYAILWCLYGAEGWREIIGADHTPRLTSTASEPHKPVTVEVSVKFDFTDDYGESGRFLLRRSVTETPGDGDEVSRGHEVVKLWRLAPSGDEPVDNPALMIDRWMPRRLADVFFADGDDVQKFITGKTQARERQEKVHQAIKNLLGINQLSDAVADIKATHKMLEARAAKAAGGKAEKLAEECTALEEEIARKEGDRAKLAIRQRNMEDFQKSTRQELEALKGLGDIERLNAEIFDLERDIDGLEGRREKNQARMQDLIKTESVSWALGGAKLSLGLGILDDLADKNVIPNTAVQVLHDRLDQERCICAEPLTVGSPHRVEVEKLLKEQQDNDELSEHLSEIRYRAKTLQDNQSQNRDFDNDRRDVLTEYAAIQDDIRRKSEKLKQTEEQRAAIDDEKVRRLAAELNDVTEKIKDAVYDLRGLDDAIERLNRELSEKQQLLQKAQHAAKTRGDYQLKRDISGDLLNLAKIVQSRLEGDYVKRVSRRLEQMFLEIIGTDPDLSHGAYTGVSITDNFDIRVGSQYGTSLNPDTEVNGASQRALTFSFMWSLMEVAGIVAPRMIDSPIGVASGDTKRRMVEMITHPPGESGTSFQVILLLTREEIKGVEDLLDERSGAFNTISCSHHYPRELVNSWELEKPVSVVCGCSHREQCKVCARKKDNDLGLRFVERGDRI